LACFGDNTQASAAAEWIFQVKGMRTINVIYDATETYTTLLQKYFVDRFAALGGQVLAVRQYDPADMRRIGEGLTPSDGVFLATGSVDDALSGIQVLRRAGLKVPIVGGDSFDSESFWEAHPEVKEVYYTTHAYLGADNPDPHVQHFSAAYHTAYGGNTPDAFAALSYDAVNLIAAAIRQSGSTSPEGVRRALAATADFKGITGSISFIGGRRIPDKSVTIMEIGSGARRFVTTFVPTVVSAP
jgi:branched-chain amino acid transport system substrate-binding protein